MEGNRDNRKGMASLAMLVVWEIWNEHNARVFNNKFTMTGYIFYRIREEACIWVKATAKRLSNLMLGE